MFKLSNENPFVGTTNSKDGVDEFERSFQDLAYAQLEKSVPEVLERVATFKISKIDLPNGKALGFFILLFEQSIGYVPVILDKNMVKPLDIMYLKEAKSFVPFSNAWIDYLDNLTDPNLGSEESDDSKRDMSNVSPKDVNVRDILVPPRTSRKSVVGRSAYAHSTDYKDAFLNFVDAIPNNAKELVKEAILKNPVILNYTVNSYDMTELKEALRPRLTKVAEEAPNTRSAFLLDKTATPHETLVKACKRFPKVAKELNSNGVAILDLRTPSEIINKIQHRDDSKFFDTPNEGGLYLVYLRNGEAKKALVIPKIYDISSNVDRFERTTESDPRQEKDPDETWIQPDEIGAETLILFNDKKYSLTKRFLATKIPGTLADGKDLLEKIEDRNPKLGDSGVWVYTRAGAFESTTKFTINRIFTKGATTRYEATSSRGDMMFISQSMNSNLEVPHCIKESKTLILPPSAVFVPTSDSVPSEYLMKSGTEMHQLRKESSVGGEIHQVGTQFRYRAFGLQSELLGPNDFIVKMANDLSLDCDEIEEIVDRMLKSGSEDLGFDLVSRLEKFAQPAAPAATPAPPAPPGMDPSMVSEMVDPATGQVAVPPGMASGPAPVSPGMMQPGPVPSPAMGAPMGAMPPQPGMDMGGMGGAGMPPGMPPQPGMGQGPMSPPFGQAVMGAQAGEAQSPEQELYPYFVNAVGSNFNISPALLDKVLELGVKGLFESVSIASLGANKSLTELSSKYLPNLKKTLNDLAQALLIVRYKSEEFRDDLGDENFSELENSLETVFADMGDLILLINKNSIQMSNTKNLLQPADEA